ncbi:hypothetical protein N474_05610 [Pseudoalteromonas luteoviolacea CPMOR-2]|uniref:Uncharacterized protein n=1 Tax=Pseudoalteromonas luteoviolacea DSM 6061 TaxID=1365250 RepID=A0A161ZGH5_9GAMM|nr:hypothetical protein N475_07895 [Pseudoalteromonas luteoviolacea DSM 6061]KZN60522.1 hypothetical protein N474_05610 [Pseudoalteromonas luteoviolacea CPMOR-2]MBE0386737.1 hypothetical protein [Pseudoalteromonas luteoviolacea DSM 6061]
MNFTKKVFKGNPENPANLNNIHNQLLGLPNLIFSSQMLFFALNRGCNKK